MPKIKAASVTEHIAQQEAAVIAAAARLFTARGVSEVTLADIAAAVGLARNSLYRYFPDKGHLLAAWFRLELTPLQQASDAIAASGKPAAERLDDWLKFQIDYLTAPEHTAMFDLAADVGSLPPEIRAEIGHGHQQLYATLESIVVDALTARSPGQPAVGRAPLITMLTAGLLRSASDLVKAGHDPGAVTAEVARAVHALVA